MTSDLILPSEEILSERDLRIIILHRQAQVYPGDSIWSCRIFLEERIRSTPIAVSKLGDQINEANKWFEDLSEEEKRQKEKEYGGDVFPT